MWFSRICRGVEFLIFHWTPLCRSFFPCLLQKVKVERYFSLCRLFGQNQFSNHYRQIRERGRKLNMGQEMLRQSSTKTGMHSKHKLSLEQKVIYICEQCSKSFNKEGGLKTHLLTHTGEKKHRCMQCDYSANHALSLRKHITTHSGEKNHTCAQCNKSFSQVSNLKTHILTHTGQKKYRCTRCNYSATQAGNLKRHIMKHTGKNPQWVRRKYSSTQVNCQPDCLFAFVIFWQIPWF